MYVGLTSKVNIGVINYCTVHYDKLAPADVT